MKVSLFLIVICFITQFSSVSDACMGSNEKMTVTYEPVGQTGDWIVKRSEGSHQKDDLLDDTGVLSFELAYVHLVKNVTDLSEDRRSEVIKIMSNRMEKMKKTFSDQPDALVHLNKIDQSLKKSIFTHDEADMWNSFRRFMYDKKIEITAKYRKANTQEWSKNELPLSDFKLPSLAVSRGCNTVIGEMFYYGNNGAGSTKPKRINSIQTQGSGAKKD